MPLSWNEIRDRALTFSREWADAKDEAADYQSFWDGFFNVYGIQRRSVALYQKRATMLDGGRGFIDVFWPGVMIAEHKGRGMDLDSAFLQASEYAMALPDHERPRYIVVSDYARFRITDLEAPTSSPESVQEFALKDLHKHARVFGFVAGYTKKVFKEEEAVNVKAAELVAKLHDTLRDTGYEGHPLEMLLVRLVFCFFGDDTDVFGERGHFSTFVETRTAEDGSDLGLHLAQFFQTLSTPKEKRQTTLDEDLAILPFVNGHLFEENLPLPSFNKSMRDHLRKCLAFNWGEISPAVFGAMFQSAMNPDERHALGAHYTSEKNILKVISGLFLDDLKQELEDADRSPVRLNALHTKLANLKVMDPACGCGNFLVVTYRELRLLEIEILRRLFAKAMKGMAMPNVATLVKVNIDKMYGIEIEELPSRIASLALWLTDHQMNMKLSEEFGQYYARLPLSAKPTIIRGNALQIDWETVIPKGELHYIVGNPPFIGSKVMTDEQRAELATLFKGVKNAGVLDYVTGWYIKAAKYIQGTGIGVAFVSTNSITQGEQVGILWKELIDGQGVTITFGHRTFKWSNEARGKAAVYCVIVGFAMHAPRKKKIYEYDDIKGDPHEIAATNINPYLVDAPNVFILSRSKPISDVPEIGIGNKPIDGGNYLFTTEERDEFLRIEPTAAPYFRRWLGADEFINGYERWCLWLGECPPEKLRQMPECMKRVEAVRQFRLASKSAPTRKLADTPTRFHVEFVPNGNYLLIPRHSTENRRYIPIGFVGPETLAGDSCLVVPNATLYHFGILTSSMHMAWVRQVCGRLKSDYRYSKDIVYNNFPWPEKPTVAQVNTVEESARAVLDVRNEYDSAALADLYDTNSMPKPLREAHNNLDARIDVAYSTQKNRTEKDRLRLLFSML